MPVTSEQSAPYTSQAVMLSLLQRNREKGLPDPLNAEQLQRLGVPDSLVPRTLQALKTLDLIREDGQQTDILERLRRAPEADYQPLMAEWLKGAYAHALDVIDPATADEVSIRDAFRHYNPISLQPRMITLFTALFEAAAVRPAAAKSPVKKVASVAAKPRVAVGVTRSPRAQFSPIPSPAVVAPGLHPALAGVLSSLPVAWTKADRDRFVNALGAVIDFVVPIVADAPPPAPDNAGAADEAP